MSPTPGRSTLITSAPNQASSCVQVGPDWTWVKSRMRTPVSALVMMFCLLKKYFACVVPPAREWRVGGLLLLQHALRIEIADAAALASGGRIDRGIDQGWLAGIHCRIHRALELVGGRRVDADAAERLHHLVVARAFDEHGGRGIGACRIDVGAAIDAVIVEDDDADRQIVAADGLDLHAGEA